MSRALVTLGRLLRALVAFAVLAGFTLGVPWLLSVAAGWPLDWIGWPHAGQMPGLTELYTAITNPWSDQMILTLLASIGWVLWLQFVRDTLIEVIEASAAVSAARHGRPRPTMGRRGPIRWVAAVLVGAILGAVLFDAARAVTGTGPTSAAAADTAARRPAVAVAPAHPTTTPLMSSGPRPARTVHVSATTMPGSAVTAIPVSTGADHGNGGIPTWARDAPGGVHQVVNGDNLWDIAEKRLGDPHRWREIYILNRGHPQANGYALSDPDGIHIGWVLALPARAATPAPNGPATPANPAPANPTPTNPAPTGPAATNPAPGRGQPGPTPLPSTPPASATPTPSTPTPSATADASSPTASASAPDTTAQPDESRDEAGISLPASGWVSLALAATIAAVAAMLRLQRRRRARLSLPVPVTTAPQPAPVPESLALLDAVGSRHLGADTAGLRPAAPSVAAPVGVDAGGAEVSLFDLPGPGIALHSDGAEPAARAILAAALATGAIESAVDARPVVVTTADLLARLLPESAPLVGLDPDGTSFDGERLIILADTAAAVTHAEEEMIGRRRLLDTFGAETIADLNARTDHAEAQPPYVLLIEATARHAGRLGAVAAHRAALDLHPVIVGAVDGIPTLQVAADGTATDEVETSAGRLATLTATDLAAVLAMLTEAVARPEPGTDVDDPAFETPPTTPAEPAEPVPAQQREAPTLVRLRVLGPVTVATDSGPVATGMRSGSYAALALAAAHPAGRTLDQLAESLHPDVDPTVAAKRVRTDINAARRVLREATGHAKAMFVIYDQATGRYRLDPEAVAVDLWQMLTAIDKANTADDDTEALAALREAAELYGGDFAANQDRAWATDYAATYRHQILTVYARIAEITEADHPDHAVAALERAVELDPVNEELYQRIMRIYGRQHRPDAVRRMLRRLEERLADLDAEPSQATRRVAERQLRPETVSGGRT